MFIDGGAMKSRVNIFILVFLILFAFTGCEMSFEKFEFEIKGLENTNVQNYLTDENAEFIRVNDVAVYHRIFALTHLEYAVHICCITNDKNAEVTLKSFELSEKESEKVLLSNEQFNSKMEFVFDNDLKLYKGGISVGELPSPDYLPNYVLSNNIDFVLKAEVEVIIDGKSEIGNIEYIITPIAYFGASGIFAV